MNNRYRIICIALVAALLVPLVSLAASKADRLWSAAERDKTRIFLDKGLQAYRHNWLNVIRKYERFRKRYPKDGRADNALLRVARLRIGLYEAGRNSKEIGRAEDALKKLIKTYPKSSLCDDARYYLGEISLKYRGDKDQAYLEFFRVTMDYPKGDMLEKAKKRLSEMGGAKPPKLAAKSKKSPPPRKKAARKPKVPAKYALVTGIRHWTNPDYTRIVVDLSKPVKYKKRLLKANPKAKRPPRLLIDMEPSMLSKELKQPIPIGDGLLRKVRAGQFRPDVVRVVLDIDSIEGYKIFSLPDPFRIVIDVSGEEEKPKVALVKPPKTSYSLKEQLGLKIRTVVIDPGHGGKDPGAVGPGGVLEKDVVLSLAKRLKSLMEKELGCRVIMTRTTDKFLPLEERTAIANTKRADLFISIHVNAHRDKRISGLQTYFLNLATDEEAVRVAALENSTTKRSLSDLEKILNDLMLNSKIAESSQLAERVHTSMFHRLRKKYSRVRDRGVKQAPFYVLIGAKMPAILVETSFITNPREAKRLKSGNYQRELARGIMEGIKGYMKVGG